MMITQSKTKKGFTLVETIVASTILCSAVLTITAVCSRALSSARINRQYETAIALINRQLSLIDYIGIDEFLEIGSMEGEFEDYSPQYTWEVVPLYQDIDNLYCITLTLSWSEFGKTYNVTVETMLNGLSTYTEETTE